MCADAAHEILNWIPNRGDVVVLPGQEPHELVLGVVEVLALVDQEVLVAGLIEGEGLRTLAEEADREGDHVVVVEEVAPTVELLEALVDRPERPVVGILCG